MVALALKQTAMPLYGLNGDGDDGMETHGCAIILS